MKIDGVEIVAGWTPTGDGGTKVAAADIEAAADIPLSKLVSAVCSETEADVKVAADTTFLGPVVSDTLQSSNDSEKSTANAAYTKIKEVKINATLVVCRLKFDFKRESSGSPAAFARVYKNGAAIGIERSTQSNTYVTYSEDFTTWAVDDLIQIYGHEDGFNGAYVRNMRFYYDLNITHIGGKELATPLSRKSVSVTNQDP